MIGAAHRLFFQGYVGRLTSSEVGEHRFRFALKVNVEAVGQLPVNRAAPGPLDPI